MDSIRCGNCSFLNFASASVCKRCKAEFEIAPAAIGSSTFVDYTAAVLQVNYQPVPQWSQPPYQQAYQPPPPYFSTPIAPLPRASKNGATNAMLWTLLGIAVVIALGIGILWKFGKTAPVNYAWQEYTSQDVSYTIQMPARPVESVQNIPSPTGSLPMHVSLANMGPQEAYLTAYIDYPDNYKSVSSDTLLDGAAQGGLTNSHSTLVSKKRITLDGYPGVEVEMTIPAGEIQGGGRAFSRIYWVAPRVYILVGGGPDSKEVKQAATKFLDSFKLKKR
jgi:hypothetical protein